jgi:very-short-patch-repair endonuclease
LTDPARTLLDLGRYLGQPRLARVVEAARREEQVDWSALIATLARHARRGRPGIRRLRAVILAGAHRDEVTDTDVELMVLSLLTQAGLPEPVLHHRVEVDGRFVAEVDLAYPQWRVAIECDGDVHLRREVRERDLPRQNDLVLEGWIVLRFSRDRVWSRPDSVLSEVRAAIRASTTKASTAGSTEPAASTAQDLH